MYSNGKVKKRTATAKLGCERLCKGDVQNGSEQKLEREVRERNRLAWQGEADRDWSEREIENDRSKNTYII